MRREWQGRRFALNDSDLLPHLNSATDHLGTHHIHGETDD